MGKTIKQPQDAWAKKLFSSDSHKRNLDLMNLLISDPDFQEIVARVRKHLGIPEGGFGPDSGELGKKWSEWMESETFRIIDSRNFLISQKQIVERENGGEITRIQAQALLDDLSNAELPLNYLQSNITIIINKFGLPLHFKDNIRYYIGSGTVSAPNHNYGPGFYQREDRTRQSRRYIPVNIYTQLTQDEWDELKHYIDWQAKGKLPKFKKMPSLSKTLKTEEVYQNRGFGEDSLYGTRYRVSAEEIAEQLFNDPTKKETVKNSSRYADKLRKKKFHK